MRPVISNLTAHAAVVTMDGAVAATIAGADSVRHTLANFALTDAQGKVWQYSLTTSDFEDVTPPSTTPVPEVVGMGQLRAALVIAGVQASAVSAAIAAIPDATKRGVAEALWNYSSDVHRDHALIGQVQAVLGLTSAQIDAIFRTAAAI